MLEEFYNKLKGVHSVVISSHVYPDSDSIGSSYALANVLKLNFPDIENIGVYLHDNIPDRNMPFVPSGLQLSYEEALEAEVLIGTDSAGADRLGWLTDQILASYKNTFNIDHHISNSRWANHNFVFPDTAACCEILAKSFFDNGLNVDKESLNLLLAGIMDDCGCFRFLNTSSQTHQVAANIIESGAENARVADLLYFNEKKEEVLAKAKLTGEIEFFEDGKIAIGVIDKEFLTEYNIPVGESLGFSDILKKIAGVVHTALIRQVEDSNWKISLRTKDFDGDVSSVAQEFGGGGHKMAAGCRIDGSIEEVKTKIVESLKKTL